MDEFANDSCWSITAWAVAVFGAVMLIAYMFGNLDNAQIVATSVSNLPGVGN